MDALQHDDGGFGVDPLDGGGELPPLPPERGGGGGRGGRDQPPRRGYRQYLPFIALGAFVIATERTSLLLMSSGGTPAWLQALAASALLGVVVGGTLLGGALFYRAWYADRA